MGNRYPHTLRDQMVMDHIDREYWELKAKEAAIQYRDLIGQAAYDNWCQIFVPVDMQSMSWQEIFSLLQVKIAEAQTDDCSCTPIHTCVVCANEAHKTLLEATIE